MSSLGRLVLDTQVQGYGWSKNHESFSCPFLSGSDCHVQMSQKDCSLAADSAPFDTLILLGYKTIAIAIRHRWSWTLSCDMHMTTLCTSPVCQHT